MKDISFCQDQLAEEFLFFILFFIFFVKLV